MPISISAANDINDLLDWAMRRPRHGGPVTLEQATGAARRLAGLAYRALSAGLTPADVTLAPREQDGTMPAEIDGMPVRAAFPVPPGEEGAMEHWTVILREPDGPHGSRYRLCRVRRAGGPGGWEVFDGMPGAQDLTWTLAAIWFARAAQVEADGREPPRDIRHLVP
jgi:hypothetical protein